MSKANPIQASFARGEISSLLAGRVDITAYPVAAKTLLNAIVRMQGPVTRRSGSYYVAETKDSTKKARLIPFEFSTTQAYVIEMGNLYFRYYKDEGRIESPPGTPVETTTTYIEAELYAMKFAQSADTLYIAHGSHAPAKLTRASHTSWTLSTIVFQDGPYLATNTTATTITLSGTTGSVTATASAITGINGGAGFATTDVGRIFRWKDPAGNWTWLTITAWTSTTVVTATISGPNASAGTATVNWRLGAWSDTTGWPASVSFFEQRLVWAGNSDQPQTIWASVTADFENMAPTNAAGTSSDSSAFTFTMAGNQVNAIRWIHPTRFLTLGTIGGAWVLRASSLDSPLTPTNVQARQQRAQGSANIQPREAGDAVLFVSRTGRKVREFSYDVLKDKYVAPDLTVMSEHVTKTALTVLDFQSEPDPILWCVRTDGQLIGCTYERDQDVVGWHRHVMGGAFGSGDAVVESVAVIPNIDGTSSQTWLTVKRTINGMTKRYIEFFRPLFTEDTDLEDAFFVDSGLTYSGAAATTISGLDHLEGQTVQILADGAVVPDQTVVSGDITLSIAASKVHVGLGYNTDIQTLRPEAGGTVGTSQGQTKRINGVTLRFGSTLGGKMGRDADHLDEIPFRTAADPMDSPPPLFTGDKYVGFDGSHDTDGYVWVRQDQPLPMTLLAVMPRIVVTER